MSFERVESLDIACLDLTVDTINGQPYPPIDTNSITALTGDVLATGPGSVNATLATVNSNIGTFGNATNSAQITVNAKGLITAVSNTPITENGITALTGDVSATGPGSVTSTLATVNSNIGTFGNSTNSAQITVNGKGLITSCSNIPIINGVGNCQTLLTSTANVTAGLTSGLYFVPPFNVITKSATSSIIAVNVVYLLASDYPSHLAGIPPTLKINCTITTNNTSPGVTFVFGLYPISSSGGAVAGQQVITLGSVVSGSDTLSMNPSGASVVSGQSDDFSFPSDGAYCIGCTLSGTTATGSYSTINAALLLSF